MSITERHRYCMGKIRIAFSPDISEGTVQNFMRDDGNQTAFTSLFNGEGPSKLFVHYQAGESGDSAEWSPETAEPELFFSHGLNAHLASRTCIFIRTTDKPIDTSKQSDDSLLFCELTSDALRSIESTLLVGSKPMFEACESWGQANIEQKEEYMAELDGFLKSLQEVNLIFYSRYRCVKYVINLFSCFGRH